MSSEMELRERPKRGGNETGRKREGVKERGRESTHAHTESHTPG